MAEDDSSELSTISSVSSVASEEEQERPQPEPKRGTILRFLKIKPKPTPKAPEQLPPARKRSPSPTRDPVLADDSNIAFIVMFRSRFGECFPKTMPTFGPQELETDIVETLPGERVELFLCGLLGLLLNRKQDVKPGHYNRALEDAIATHRAQWSPSWGDKNPLAGSASFASLSPAERLKLLKMLIIWAMNSSETIRTFLAQKYKQNRHEDDLNQPLSVQPWGSDSDKRRYFLIHGLDDTAFRVYRESNPAGYNRTWMTVAGTTDELKSLANKLETKDGGSKARQLSMKINVAIPRFEAMEEKRKRREYRQMKKSQFKRPEPGFSLYEGRTRGKRVKYTFSDDEDEGTSGSTTRRAGQNSGFNTPTEPTTTLRGRQVRPPQRMVTETINGASGVLQSEDVIDVVGSELDLAMSSSGRLQRAAATRARAKDNGHASAPFVEIYGKEEDEDTVDDGSESGFGDEDDADEHVPEDDSDNADDELDEGEATVEDELMEQPRRSLLVKVKVPNSSNVGRSASKKTWPRGESAPSSEGPMSDVDSAPSLRATSPMAVDGQSYAKRSQNLLAYRGNVENHKGVAATGDDS